MGERGEGRCKREGRGKRKGRTYGAPVSEGRDAIR